MGERVLSGKHKKNTQTRTIFAQYFFAFSQSRRKNRRARRRAGKDTYIYT
jgi:hypothetical protein